MLELVGGSCFLLTSGDLELNIVGDSCRSFGSRLHF